MHEKYLQSGAPLAVVGKNAGDALFYGRFQVRVVEYYAGILRVQPQNASEPVRLRVQALERVGGAHGHKGEEAALTAVEVVRQLQALEQAQEI